MAKKGSITDLPFIIGGIFSVALIALLVTFLVNNLNDEVQDIDMFNSNAKSASSKMADDFPNVMNGGILFIFFGLVFVSFILAALVPIHPIFLPFYLLEYVILIWLSAGIANAYQTITELSVMASTAAQYDLAIFFFHYFPYAVGLVGALLAIIMYKVKSNFLGG